MPLGNHISKDGERMHKAIASAMLAAEEYIELECAQIFVMGPRSAAENLDDAEKDGIKNIINDKKIRMYAHASYLSNPWGVKSAFGVSLVKREMKICDELGFVGLVVHLARKPPKVIAAMISTLISETQTVKLFLEIESYKPLADKIDGSTCTYETPQKLGELAREIHSALNVANAANEMHRIGICIDTAHLWAAGTDISTYNKMSQWLTDTKRELSAHGCNNLLVHLNDQIWTLGGGRDEHAPLLRGTIWGSYNPAYGGTDTPENSGLQKILEWSNENSIDMIMERKSNKPVTKNEAGIAVNNIMSDYVVISSMGFPE